MGDIFGGWGDAQPGFKSDAVGAEVEVKDPGAAYVGFEFDRERDECGDTAGRVVDAMLAGLGSDRVIKGDGLCVESVLVQDGDFFEQSGGDEPWSGLDGRGT